MIDDAALWQEFAGESEDHLDTIDRILSAGESDRAAVDRLFRAFHSLKGMSDALGAPGMKHVAHRAEDLLGLARNGRLAVQGAVADGLLAAVDTLRRQRATLLEAHRDVPAPADLLARLAGLAEAGPARPVAPPISTTPVSAAPVSAAPPKPPVLGAGAALLGALASRFEAASPLLAGLVQDRKAEAVREAAELAEAARMLGLARLAAAVERLAEPGGGLPALGALRRGLALLQDEAGEAAGAAALAAAPAGASVALGPRLAALALQLESALAGGDATAAMHGAADAAEVAAAFGLEGLEQLLLALADLTDRAADPDAAAILAAQGPVLVERLRQAAEGGLAALCAMSEALPGAEPADPRIPAGFAALLGAEGRRRVVAAVEGGRLLVRLRMAIGLPAELEAAIAAALSAEAEVLTSRTVLDGQPPHLDMLLAGPAEFEALSRALNAADPAGSAVLDLAPAEIGPAPEALPARGMAVTMRVRQETIDQIIALETEVRAAVLALAEALDDGGAAEALAVLGALERRLPSGVARELGGALGRLRQLQETLERSESRLALGMRRLDDAVMELRVVPVGTLFGRLPRVVRAVAQASAREVELVMEGEDVTIDRSLVELLADPLLHLTRNAVDHGIEAPEEREAAGKPRRGQLRISAARRTGQVWVRVSEDGRGIDRDRVLARAVARGIVSAEQAAQMGEEEVYALLFRPGFSTAATVTETSGRGVGLDVVQDAIRRAGGTVEVASAPGQGTSFTLRLPLTAAVQPVLLVEAAGHPYALPAARVEAVLEGGSSTGCEVLALATLLGVGKPPGAACAIVIVKSGGRSFGLAVDRVQRRTDLLLRPLHPALATLPGIGGVGVLGNGEPVLVLEPDGFAPEAPAG